MTVFLITGAASNVQGWGDEGATQAIKTALESSGKRVEIIDVGAMNELERSLDQISKDDIVWSSLYFVSDRRQQIGPDAGKKWVPECLEERGLAFVGSPPEVLRLMIDKAETRQTLSQKGIAVPRQQVVRPGESPAKVCFPAFVKPSLESNSSGVTEASVVHTTRALEARVHDLHRQFQQPALVEEYLPGKELTVTVLGNGGGRQFFPIICSISPSAYKDYPVIRSEMLEEGLVEFQIPAGDLERKSIQLASETASALGCLDHVRVDMREGSPGVLKVIEVNGIPGLCPLKSRSLEIYKLHTGQRDNQTNYAALVNKIVDSALVRYRHPTSASRLDDPGVCFDLPKTAGAESSKASARP